LSATKTEDIPSPAVPKKTEQFLVEAAAVMGAVGVMTASSNLRRLSRGLVDALCARRGIVSDEERQGIERSIRARCLRTIQSIKEGVARANAHDQELQGEV
jgi:hypothetical protein